MPASAVLVGVLLATWPLLAWPLRERFGVRAAIVPPLTSVALLPFVILGSLWACSRPLVDLEGWKSGGVALVAAFGIGVLAAGALLLAYLWACYVASPPGRRRVDATLRALAVLAIGAGAALGAWGVVQSLHGPDADGWAESLPLATHPPEAVSALAFDRLGWSFYDIRHDDVRDLWVATAPGRGGAGRTPVLALGCALVPRTLLPRDLEGIAPPRGWVAEALGGVTAALVSIAIALGLARRHRRKRAGVPAEHLGGGWLVVEGAPPVHAPELGAAAPGPVIVQLGASSPPTYRGTGAPASLRVVAAGTIEDVDDTARSIATAGYAVALAIIVLACAPLAVA
jgi:hypothetical protein